MHSKIVIAFVAGAVIASGIVYMAVKEELPPRSAAASADIPQPAPPKASPVPVVAANAPVPPSLPLALVREKPSPIPPRIRPERPLAAARHQDAPPRPEPVVEAPPPPTRPPVEAEVPSQPPQSAPPEAITPQPEPAVPQPEPPRPEVPEAPRPDIYTAPTVTITAGTMLPVRIGETISAAHYQAGDSFLATLDRQLVVDGWVIAEKGSRLEGRVVEAEPGGRTKSTSHLGIELVKLSTADGQHIQIRTQAYKKEALSSTGSDVAKVGVGAALGAAIGAAAGGGKGAAIGVGAGAAAGAAGAMLTRGKSAEIPVESRISFRIADPVTITERRN